MDQRYYEIYEDLFDLYRSQQTIGRIAPFTVALGPNPIRAARRVLKPIEEAERRLAAMQKSLRPDARLLLLVNLHQMVLAPLEHPDTTAPLTKVSDTQLRRDVWKIVEAAANASSEDEISGHSILEAVVRQWKSLNLAKVDVWG